MSTEQHFSVSQSELEDDYDIVKGVVIQGLVTEGLLDPKVADEWAKVHTILLRKNNWFKRLFENSADAHGKLTIKLVKLV